MEVRVKQIKLVPDHCFSIIDLRLEISSSLIATLSSQEIQIFFETKFNHIESNCVIWFDSHMRLRDSIVETECVIFPSWLAILPCPHTCQEWNDHTMKTEQLSYHVSKWATCRLIWSNLIVISFKKSINVHKCPLKSMSNSEYFHILDMASPHGGPLYSARSKSIVVKRWP